MGQRFSNTVPWWEPRFHFCTEVDLQPARNIIVGNTILFSELVSARATQSTNNSGQAYAVRYYSQSLSRYGQVKKHDHSRQACDSRQTWERTSRVRSEIRDGLNKYKAQNRRHDLIKYKSEHYFILHGVSSFAPSHIQVSMSRLLRSTVSEYIS